MDGGGGDGGGGAGWARPCASDGRRWSSGRSVSRDTEKLSKTDKCSRAERDGQWLTPSRAPSNTAAVRRSVLDGFDHMQFTAKTHGST